MGEGIPLIMQKFDVEHLGFDFHRLGFYSCKNKLDKVDGY